MKFKYIALIIIILFFSGTPEAGELKTRPRELRFFVNSHLTTTTIIDYNSKGDVLKMSSFENNKLTDYAKYRYDDTGRLNTERTFDASNILIKTRYYSYNESGLVSFEKIYSPENKLIEYLVLTYTEKKLQKIDYFKSDEILYQSINFYYNGDRISEIIFDKKNKYSMAMKAVYDRNMILRGHIIKHSNADVRIETKYIYEDGFATDEALQIIFR